MKNPTLATVLNIFPGLGYIYIGGRKRVFGILLLIAIISVIVGFFDPLLYTEDYSNTEYMNSELRIWDLLYLLAMVLPIIGFMYDGYTSTLEHNKLLKKK